MRKRKTFFRHHFHKLPVIFSHLCVILSSNNIKRSFYPSVLREGELIPLPDIATHTPIIWCRPTTLWRHKLTFHCLRSVPDDFRESKRNCLHRNACQLKRAKYLWLFCYNKIQKKKNYSQVNIITQSTTAKCWLPMVAKKCTTSENGWGDEWWYCDGY